MKKRLEQKMVFVSLLLFFIFNMPFLLLFEGSFGEFETPTLYVGIIAGWLFAVLLSYKILKRKYSVR